MCISSPKYDTGVTARDRLTPAPLRSTRREGQQALALDFKIQRFVRCREVAENRDGSIDAGWYYHAQEKIARANGRGVWGFQVDSIRRQ